ncbi:MAG: hypothetical protein ACE5JF_12605 [Anaerolineales bacterium]
MFNRMWSLIAVLIVVGTFGCSTPTVRPTTELRSTPQPAATSIPSATPVPIPQVLLIAEDPVTWEDDLSAWALGSGWNLTKPDLPGAATYLRESSAPIAAVSVGEVLDGELEGAAARGLPIVAINVAGIKPGASLSTIGSTRYDQAGFLAGVMTGLASQTGWVGEVTATGGEHEAAYDAGFTQGLLWGCPKCQLISQTAAEMTLDRFFANSVDVVFPYPGSAASAVVDVLTEAGLPMVWVGSNGPAGDMLVGRVSVVDHGFTVILALEDLMETGEGRFWQPSIETWSIVPEEINPELLSLGRQRLLEEAFYAIVAGELDIGTEPDA